MQRCFVGIRQSLSKQEDERYKDTLSIEFYFQALCFVDTNLPKIQEVESVVGMPVQLAQLPQLLPLAAGVEPSLKTRYIQFLQTLAGMKDKENRDVGREFITLPREFALSFSNPTLYKELLLKSQA